MAHIVQIQFVPRSRRNKETLLMVLDSEGAIWYTKDPFNGNDFDWHPLRLPPALEYPLPNPVDSDDEV